LRLSLFKIVITPIKFKNNNLWVGNGQDMEYNIINS